MVLMLYNSYFEKLKLSIRTSDVIDINMLGYMGGSDILLKRLLVMHMVST